MYLKASSAGHAKSCSEKVNMRHPLCICLKARYADLKLGLVKAGLNITFKKGSSTGLVREECNALMKRAAKNQSITLFVQITKSLTCIIFFLPIFIASLTFHKSHRRLYNNNYLAASMEDRSGDSDSCPKSVLKL